MASVMVEQGFTMTLAEDGETSSPVAPYNSASAAFKVGLGRIAADVLAASGR